MKTMYLPRISISHVFLLVLACLGTQAMAGTHVWTGGGATGKWSLPANWDTGVVPVTGEVDENGNISTVVEFRAVTGKASNATICDIDVTLDQLHFVSGTTTIAGDNNSSHELAISGDHKVINMLDESPLENTIGGNSSSTVLKFKMTGTGGVAFSVIPATSLKITANLTGDTPITLGGPTAGVGGTTTLSGNNDFSSNLDLLGGTLVLNSPNSVNGSVSAVSSISVENGAILQLGQSNTLGDGADVTVEAGGLFDMKGFTDAIGGLTVHGGVVKLANGTTYGKLTTSGPLLVADGLVPGQATATHGSVLVSGGTLTCSDPLGITDGSITLGNGTTVGTLNVNQSLTMAGGSIGPTAGATATQVLNLNGNGNVTATSSALGTATITCLINLNISSAARLFSVALGPQGQQGGQDLVIIGPIAEGPGFAGAGLTKLDFGVLRLSSTVANTFTGTTTVDRGTLELNNTGGLSVLGPLILGNAGAVDTINSAIIRDISDNQIINTKSLVINKTGQIDLNNHAESFINLAGSGTISLGNGAQGATVIAGVSYPGGSITFGSDDSDSNWSGVLIGTGVLEKTGAGTFNYTGTSTAQGAVYVENGTFTVGVTTVANQGIANIAVVGAGTGAHTATLNLLQSNKFPDAGTVVVNSDGVFNIGSLTSSFSDVIGFLKVNGGTVNLVSGQLEVSRGLNMIGGTINANNSGSLILSSDATVTSSASAAALINSPVALKTDVRVTVPAGSLQPAVNFANSINNSGGSVKNLTKSGPGVMLMTGTNANTYTGTTIVDQGGLQLNHPGASNAAIKGPLVIGNGTDAANQASVQFLSSAQTASGIALSVNASGILYLNNNDVTFGSLASTSPGGTINGGTAALTVGDTTSSEFDGSVFSNGFAKVGSGTLTLGGTVTLAGSAAVTVNAGQLLVNGSLYKAIVASGATIGGSGEVQFISATAANATVFPGLLTGGSLHSANGSFDVNGGTFAVALDDTTAQNSSRAVVHDLSLSAAGTPLVITGQPAKGPYVIASYTNLTGTFATASLPAGYSLLYNYNDHVTNKNIAIYKPSVTLAATDVSAGSATLNGIVTLTGTDTSAHFDYGTTTAYGLSTTPQALGSDTNSVVITEVLKLLTPATTYHFRLVVTTSGGDLPGADLSFTTPDGPPVVTTAATTVTSTTAKLNGTIQTGGRNATYYFEYGEVGSNPPYPIKTKATAKATAAGSPAVVTAAVTGLLGGRTYHFRIVGTFDVSNPPTHFYYGDELTFTTSGAVVKTLDATSVASLSATANGTVNPRGKTATVYFEYGLTVATGVQTYPSTTTHQALAAANADVMVTGAIVPKAPAFNKSYTYRIVAISGADTSKGDPKTFTTKNVLAPVITTPPVAKLAALGSSVTFSVVVSENPPTDSVPAYQWYKNGAAVALATSANYVIPAVTLLQAGAYTCKVTNANSSVTTAPVPLAVVDVTSKSLNLAAAATATMAVNNATATTAPLGFAWKKGAALAALAPDGTRIIIASKTLTIKLLKAGDATDTPAGDSDTYTCVVTGNAFGLQTLSVPFVLKVFNDKPVITSNPVLMPDGVVSGIYAPATAPAVPGFKIPVDPSSKLVPTSYSATGLPKGLVLNTVTGVISGRPTVSSPPDPANPGSYKPLVIMVKATNGKGSTLATPAWVVIKPLPTSSVGTFNGLVDRDSETAPTLTKGYGGKITVSVLPAGTFTGSLSLGGAVASSFLGVLETTTDSTTSTAVVTVKRTAPLVALTLNLTFNETGELDGTVTDHVITTPLPLKAWVNPWTVANKGLVPAALATKYTASLEITNAALVGTDPTTTPAGDPANVQYPQGNGYTAMTISTAGVVTWVGKMADGIIPATYSTTLAADGSIPVHLMLYVNTGSAHGWVTAKADDPVPANQTNGGLALLDGTLDWNKTAQIATSKDLVYKAGFPKHDLTVLGGAYVAPAAKTPVLGVTDTGNAASTNAHLTFTEGGLKDIAASPATGTHPAFPFVKGSAMASNLDLNVRITTGNVGAFPTGSNPAAITLSIVPATGVMSGAFTLKDADPTGVATKGLSRPGTYGGVIVNRVGVKKGIGFFLLQELPVVGPPKTTLAVMPKLSGQVILDPVAIVTF